MSLFSQAITISGNPATMTINTAVAGQQPTSRTNTSTTYSVNTGLSVTSVNGKISTNMPSGVTLRVTLAAPTGATSLGAIVMTTVAQNLVTGINILTISGARTITYNLAATVNAAQVTSATNTLTLTIQ